MTKNQSLSDNRDRKNGLGQEGPSSEFELGHRISVVVSAIGTQKKASEIAGVTSEQIGRWRNGATKIPLQAAAQLCAAAGRSLDWLAFGHDPDTPQQITQVDPIDLDTMEAVIESVMRELALQEKRLDPGDFGKLCRLVYEATRDKPEGETRRSLTRSALRLVSSQ